MPHPSPTLSRKACLVLAAIACGMSACRDRNITSYRIPKEADAAAAPAAEPATPADAAGIHWAAPAGWRTQPASGMRQGSFLVSDANGASADVSVVSFPGTGGDDLANINRWRNQLSLPPISQGELAGQLQGLASGAGQFVVADMTGVGSDKNPARILGAWLRLPGHVWFFKMMGPSGIVETQKDAFGAFLQSVSFAAGPAAGPALAQDAGGQANTNDLPRRSVGEIALPAPAAAAPAPMDSVPVQAESGASLLWTAPADWQNAPGNAMRRGSYAAGGGAEVAITAFPGDVGGVLANVNRWRGQAGLSPVDEAGLAQSTAAVDSNGLHFVVLDASDGASPIVAALVPWNGGTWFFKLTGPSDAVARAKPSFMAFLRTVRTP